MLVLTYRFLPEFLRSPRAAFGGCSPHAPEGAVSRPPSGATLPPGEGIGAVRLRTPREGGPAFGTEWGNKSQKFYLLFPGKWVTLSVLIF